MSAGVVATGILGILVTITLAVLALIYGMKDRKREECEDQSKAWLAASGLAGVVLLFLVALLVFSVWKGDNSSVGSQLAALARTAA